EGVTLADERAVRDAVDAPALDAERPAEELHVGDDVVGAVEASALAERRRARSDGARARRIEVGVAHRLLQGRAAKRARAGAALVVQDEAVVAERRAEPAPRRVDERDARLARPAGEEEQDAARRVDVVRG